MKRHDHHDRRTRLTTRRAAVAPGSFDAKTRTFSAVAATGTPVKRRDFLSGEMVHEVLVISAAAIDLGRLNSGRAPLLNSHAAFDVLDQIGVVRAARIEGGKLVVDCQLSARDDLAPLAADVGSGVVANCSVGYRIIERDIVPGEPGKPSTLVVKRWEPAEVSLVSIGADHAAHIRSGAHTMDNQHPIDADDQLDQLDDAPAPPAAPVIHRSAAAERRRASEIVTIGREARIDGDEVERALTSGTTLDAFRRRAFAIMADRDRAIPSGHVEAGDDGLGKAISDALLSRMTGRPAEGRAAEFRGLSLIEIGRTLLQARGERTAGMSRDRIAERMLSTREGGLHTTSDFPQLLTGSGNRILLDSYKASSTPLKMLARRRTANDFRAISLLRLSETPRLLKVNESGEVMRGTMGETKQGFSVLTYARIFGLTRQAIINDDLGAFADTARAWGAAAAQLEADKLVELLTQNSGNGINLSDGQPLYTTVRTNKAAAATAIDITNLSLARQALREMKGLDGATTLGITPKFLLVGAAKETQAEQIVATLAAAQTSNANPFSGKLTVLVEPRLTGNAWRLFADPAEAPVLEMAHLAGNEGPIMSAREGWDVLGVEFRAVLDFGCGASDFRGSFLNAGA